MHNVNMLFFDSQSNRGNKWLIKRMNVINFAIKAAFL